MAKDDKFIRSVIARNRNISDSTQKSIIKEEQYITGNDIANNTILTDHLTNSSITSDKLNINNNLIVNSGKIQPTAGSGNNGIVFPFDPGGGSGDGASIKYYARDGEKCNLDISITNDADDYIFLTTPSASMALGQITYISNNGGTLNVNSIPRIKGASGQTSVIIPETGGSYASDWPGGWWGGLATWDIICASIQGNIVNTSDARLKNDITPINKGLDLVLKLNPVSFYWTKEYNSSLKNQQFGFIAQDVEKLMPELVIPGSYDEVKREEGARSLNYIGIIPFLTKAIQEQQEQIESQQKTIESLEIRLKALEDLLK